MKEINSQVEREETLAELREPMYDIIALHVNDLAQEALRLVEKYRREGKSKEQLKLRGEFDAVVCRAFYDIDVYATFVGAVGGDDRDNYLEKAVSLSFDLTRNSLEWKKVIYNSDTDANNNGGARK